MNIITFTNIESYNKKADDATKSNSTNIEKFIFGLGDDGNLYYHICWTENAISPWLPFDEYYYNWPNLSLSEMKELVNFFEPYRRLLILA